jgi:ATP-binding protein involved in chromosome partitioning
VAQRAADMAKRSFLPVVGVIENMSAFVCDHGESYALFGSGGGEALAAEIDAPLLGQVPLEPSVAAGNDAGEPVALAGEGRAADVFREIAGRLAAEIAPPTRPEAVDMAGCSARMLEAVAVALGPKS